MKVIHGSESWKEKKTPLGVALGNFDGVHKGHQAILAHLIKASKKEGWKSCVYTFEPHPAKILAPETAPLLIQTMEQKLEALENLGIDMVVLEPFNLSFSKREPQAFFNQVLIGCLQARGLWVGYDFTFGVKRSGTVTLLKKFCDKAKVVLHVTGAQFAKAALISSTQIRSLIASGHVRSAEGLLGRPFSLIGSVVKGYGIGGKMGIHTANLQYENELIPKLGIYITRTKVQNKKGWDSWPSATSVGFNPTFPGKGFSVETHLIGFEGDLRNKKIEVEFLKWLREEWTFPNAETLAVQIQKDIAEAKKFHRAIEK